MADDKHSPPINATGWRAVVKRWRRTNRQRLNRLLTRLFGTTVPRAQPLNPDIRRILVVRLNKRLGNILFLSPMLRTLAATLPDATLDVLIQDERHKPLLESLPGVGRVWIQPRSLGGLVGLIRRMRGRRYDLAIDPSGNSSSNRLAIALCGARYRMGFAARDQWLRLSHAAPSVSSRHQAIQAVQLLTHAAEGTRFECFDTLAVFPGERAQAAALAQWQRALGEPAAPVIGFFVQATGRKQLPEAWWREWCAAMRDLAPDAALLQIRPPGDAAPLLPDLPGVAIAELDILAALVARLDVFVAADSGPMHLAAAAGTPVVGLFRATCPDAYAPLGHGCISLSGDALTAEGVARATHRVLVP